MSAGPASLLNIQRGELTAQGWTQVHTYQVITTDGTDGPDVVLNASGLPAFGASLAYDPLSKVSRITPIKQDGATIHWEVEVEYSRETANQQDNQQPPTLRPVKRSASVRWVEKALQRSRTLYTDDTPPVPYHQSIVTSAKTPFNPPITISVAHSVVRFQRWENSFSTATQRAYLGRVNSTQFGVFPPGWVMCTNIEASEEWEQDAEGNPQKFWTVTYEFESCAGESDTFDPIRVLDADFWFLDPDEDDESKKRKKIYIKDDGTYTGDPTANGVAEIPSPIPISGGLIPNGSGWRLPTDADPVSSYQRIGDVLTPDEISGIDGVLFSQPSLVNYLKFYVYELADFNELGLPVD